ncbi:hypothetical protein N6H18_14190 [Reichenbachiella agarivorans]|uniref:Transposase IS200-like domain-containing protein n=1 Tax=Reichenbachiella agarivorans TaxID=2979464 RepID=A0ABY6CQ70_9BACT|nr:hypothetical protein [Reichenbachiella agarivorans]UXP31498.1 hypothetical protein N6H18_14190 [Reichenbachiella agarivorans]
MQAETYYHIYNHANESENLFKSTENYRFFLQQWAKYIEPVAETYAYCLMPNHFHALIRVYSDLEIANNLSLTNKDLTGFKNLSGLISKQFSNLFNSYTKAVNKQLDRQGSLFNRPFKSKEITNNDYLTKVIHYLSVRKAGIHHNPIHHRFCKQYDDWPHSSYQAMISDAPTKLQRKEVIEWFGSTAAFKSFHQENIIYPDQIKLE